VRRRLHVREPWCLQLPLHLRRRVLNMRSTFSRLTFLILVVLIMPGCGSERVSDASCGPGTHLVGRECIADHLCSLHVGPGAGCGAATECCSGSCHHGDAGGSYCCTLRGEACKSDEECCPSESLGNTPRVCRDGRCSPQPGRCIAHYGVPSIDCAAGGTCTLDAADAASKVECLPGSSSSGSCGSITCAASCYCTTESTCDCGGS